MAKFENASEQYWFVFKDNNNKTVLQSQMYSTKQHAETGIKSIKQEASAAEVDDQTHVNHAGHESVENYGG